MPRAEWSVYKGKSRQMSLKQVVYNAMEHPINPGRERLCSIGWPAEQLLRMYHRSWTCPIKLTFTARLELWHIIVLTIEGVSKACEDAHLLKQGTHYKPEFPMPKVRYYCDRAECERISILGNELGCGSSVLVTGDWRSRRTIHSCPDMQ